MSNKHCTTCLVSKPLTEFFKKHDTKDGHMTRCKVCHGERTRAYYARNAERLKDYAKVYHSTNKEENLAQFKAYYAENKPTIRKLQSEYAVGYRAAHLPQLRAHTAKRRSAKMRRTPPWADIEAIKQFHTKADRLTRETGEVWEVDHIVPLQGKLVSGLHTHTNLAVLRRSENRSKGNRYWPDMP